MKNIAIIVPFRIQEGQNREWELSQFIPHMIKFMNNLIYLKKINKFHIYVIQQNQSQKKFNRGILLNIGAKLVHPSYDTLIFHDVDLLPQEDLNDPYSLYPVKMPIHIAACWKSRYGNSKNYFGGIVSFNRQQFEMINGFPNNFWGWGGEDDVLYDRCKNHGISVEKIHNGTISDIETNDRGETMDIEKKLCFLRKNKHWKCNHRWELRNMDKLNFYWKFNGYDQIHNHYHIHDWITIHDSTIVHVFI